MLNSFCILALIVALSNGVRLPIPKREYVVKKDALSGMKADQFSVYADQAETDLRYRIESYYSPMQKIELQTYPYKKVVGRLDAQQLGTYYDARYEILDARNESNKWFTGHVKRNAEWFSDKYNINLAERKITMKSKFLSSKYKFFNEAGKLVAMFQRRYALVAKYNLKVFSNGFPDSVYILALAAHDHKRTTIFGNANEQSLLND